jgi:pimeloyl-ACP methyl ester carboxylesterase
VRSQFWNSSKRAVAAAGALLALAGCATSGPPLQLAGAQCVAPPVMRCPDANCPSATVTNQGSVIEPKTNRTYFLDYPCDLKKGEDVNVILSLHGGGSYGNWQRHYFPIVDYVNKYRIVLATPNTRGWSPNDDAYLQNIVSSIVEQIGKENVKSFWLVGHSMGSFNSRRLVCTEYFRNKADGYLSLSGGRVGSAQSGPTNFNIPRQDDSITAGRPAGPPPGAGGARPAAGGPPGAGGVPGAGLQTAAAQSTLDCDFSHIYAGGAHEPSAKALPATSSWAEKYSCGARVERKTVVDAKGGYVYDSSRQQYGSDEWGRLPRAGSAKIMEYPNCKDDRVVADVIRLDKGHTEGLEPKITEELLNLMFSAKSGKIRSGQ